MVAVPVDATSRSVVYAVVYQSDRFPLRDPAGAMLQRGFSGGCCDRVDTRDVRRGVTWYRHRDLDIETVTAMQRRSLDFRAERSRRPEAGKKVGECWRALGSAWPALPPSRRVGPKDHI